MKTFNFTLEEKVITWVSSNFQVESENFNEAKKLAIELIKNGLIDGEKIELIDSREKILPSIDNETEILFFDNDKIWDNSQKINQINSYGQEHGYWEVYNNDGKLVSKGNYVNGQKDGYWEYYYSNGQLWVKGNYVYGKPHGYWETFSENGKLSIKGNYENGIKDGYWEEYNLNGNIFSKGNYENGNKVGEWSVSYL